MKRTGAGADAHAAAKKKQIIALAVLLTVLAVIWLSAALKDTPSAASGTPVSAPKPAAVNSASPVSDVRSAQRLQVQVQWPAMLIRDPFGFDEDEYDQQQTERPRIDQSAFELQGTILGDDPRALINGQAIRIGGTIRGAIVKKIEHGHVIIEIDGVDVRLGQ